MFKFCASIFLIIFYSLSFSQVQYNYKPIEFTDTIPNELNQQLNSRLEKDKSDACVALKDKKVCKYKCSLYDQRTKEVINRFNKDYFIIDTVFTPYLQNIANNIYTANPQLKKETRIFAYRSNVPNAICFGEGTISFNLGLLQRMENEDQMAFILCHELAHYHLSHTEKQIEKLTALNFDEDLEKQLNAIKYSDFNKYTRLKELVKEMSFDVTKHSRVNESEADSIGLEYMKATIYNPMEAIRTMELLDSSDLPVYPSNIDLKKHFNFKKYPFAESWLAYDSSEFNYAVEEYSGSDTNSTHPDCKKRIAALKRQLPQSAVQKVNSMDAGRFNHVKQVAEFEIIETLYHYRDLGGALFETLILLEKYPENAYLHAMVGKCLYGIYYNQTLKRFGAVVSLPDNRYPENYNRFLTFLHTLRLKDVGNISINYLETHFVKFGKDEEYLYTMIMNSDIPGSFDKNSLLNNYKELYPKGKYINILK